MEITVRTFGNDEIDCKACRGGQSPGDSDGTDLCRSEDVDHHGGADHGNRRTEKRLHARTRALGYPHPSDDDDRCKVLEKQCDADRKMLHGIEEAQLNARDREHPVQQYRSRVGAHLS